MKPIHYLKLTLFFVFCTLGNLIHAQVKGISYTLSPTIEYNWNDDKSGLEDNFLIGGKFGIGFGEFLELRGIYMQALNQKTAFSDFGLANYSDDLFVERDVDFIRYGGELKANLGKGKFLPFITLGTGIQSIQLDTFAKNKNIYVNLGLGLKFSIADRFLITIEAKNTPYNFNAGQNLLTAEDKATFGVGDNDFKTEQLKNNWSAGASLQFYLGGRRPGELSELDKAYLSTFSGGLRGLSIPIEPTLAYINFDKNLAYRDAWLFGGYAGLDINQYIGIRAFYFQAMDNEEVSTDFDGLSMYGGELRLKLNAGKGLKPYLIIGGGQLNVNDSYEPKGLLTAESQAFAYGGAGLTLAISSRFKLFGSARLLLTAGTDIEDINAPDQVTSSTMWTVGTRFIIGKKATPNKALDKRISSEVDSALEAQKRENEIKRKALQQKYEAKVVDLEKDLNKAYEKQDSKKAAALLKEKKENEAILAELKMRQQRQTEMLKDSLDRTEEELAALRLQYENQITALEKDLNNAYEKEDVANANTIIEEKSKVEQSLNEVKKAQLEQQQSKATVEAEVKPAASTSNGRIQMSPNEFENLIKVILENMVIADPDIVPEPEVKEIEIVQDSTSIKANQAMTQRMERIEMLLIKMNESQKDSTNTSANSNPVEAANYKQMTEMLMLEIEKLNQKIDQSNQEIEKLKKTKAVPPKEEEEEDNGNK